MCIGIKKNVGENRGEMENSSVYRILRIEGSAEPSRCTCLDIDLHALIMNDFCA